MLAARLAVRQGVAEDLEPALLAMSHIDRAIERADVQVRKTQSARDKIDAAQARFERGDLLMMVGLDRFRRLADGGGDQGFPGPAHFVLTQPTSR